MQDNLRTCLGYYGLELGFLEHDNDWLACSNIRNYYRIGTGNGDCIADFEYLPIASESIDCLIATHALGFVRHPHQVLREIDRVLIPEGKLILMEFNPYSIQQFSKLLKFNDGIPRNSHFYPVWRIKEWLSVLGLEMKALHYLAPAFTIHERLRWARYLSEHCLSWTGRVAVIIATKRISRLTPLHTDKKIRPLLKSSTVQPTAFGSQ